MNKKLVRKVEFYSAGSFMANASRIEIGLDQRPADIQWPDNAYAFRIYERQDIVDGDDVYVGKESQVGPMYFHPDSKVETLAEVKARSDDTLRILISNMESNRWDHIIWSRWGNFPQPFRDGKELVL